MLPQVIRHVPSQTGISISPVCTIRNPNPLNGKRRAAVVWESCCLSVVIAAVPLTSCVVVFVVVGSVTNCVVGVAVSVSVMPSGVDVIAIVTGVVVTRIVVSFPWPLALRDLNNLPPNGKQNETFNFYQFLKLKGCIQILFTL